MKCLLFMWAIIAYTYGNNSDEVQYVKTVKGGPSRFIYLGGDISRFYNSRQLNLTKSHREAVEVGVCYIEVPTAQLFSDQTNIPPGNGTRPDLSRIRTCCHGFTRNIYDHTVCDPVCSKGCVNSLCIAPETCQCYPDYVLNAAGECTATCPIGCKHGRCEGAQCVCDDGYKLDSEENYCIPSCKENCGGVGNCTAANTCICQPGYQSTAEGSCKPICEHCVNGECTAPNTCICHIGYAKDSHGKCAPQCNPACRPKTRCLAPNVCSPPPSDYFPQYSSNSPLEVVPLYPENQVYNSPNPQIKPTPYPNPYDPKDPQYQVPGKNSTTQPIDYSQHQEVQVQQRPDDSFQSYQIPTSYPHADGRNPQQRHLLNNNLNSTQQRAGQEQIQQTSQYPINPYPGVRPETFPDINQNSSIIRRGDIESANNKYSGQVSPDQTSPNNNSYSVYPGSNYNTNYHESNSNAGDQQQNISNSTNRYGLSSNDYSNQGTYNHIYQGAYNKSQEESHDFRNHETSHSTQHESHNTSNQKSNDASQRHSYDEKHEGQHDTEYTQISYGNFNFDTQNALSHKQFETALRHNYANSSQERQSSSNQSTYGLSQQGALDSSRHEIQSSTNEGNLQQGTYKPNQELYHYHNSNNDQSNRTYDSSQHRSYDSSRRLTHNFTHNDDYYTHRESYKPPSLQIFPYYSLSNNPTIYIPKVSNQVSDQNGTDNSHHTNAQGINIHEEQQPNNVPLCSKPCINGHCVGNHHNNECRCKPGYIPDKANPNVCQPHCPGGCSNGVCSGPRFCLCNVGYTKDTSVKGTPVCVKRYRESYP